MEKGMIHIGFRISRELHDKLVYVAEYDGRTMNGQLRFLMERCVREFEKEHGVITQELLEEVNVVSRS